MRLSPVSSDYSIVILSWNNLRLIDFCLAPVLAQSVPPLEIIWVDNGSQDGSVEYLRSHYPKVRIIAEETNWGFAKGNNIGIAKALANSNCRFVAVVNTDARLEPDWAEKILIWAHDHPDAACLQGAVYADEGLTTLDSVGIRLNLAAVPIQDGQGSQVMPSEPIRVFGVHGAAALYKREFLETQPFGHQCFDEDFFMYLEDVDLSLRSLIMGKENWMVPSAKAYHLGSASSAGDQWLMLYRTHRNLPLLIIKNLPWQTILFALPSLWHTELLRLFNYLRWGQFRYARAMIAGRLSSVWLWPLFLIKRQRLNRWRRIDRVDLEAIMQKVPSIEKLPQS